MRMRMIDAKHFPTSVGLITAAILTLTFLSSSTCVRSEDMTTETKVLVDFTDAKEKQQWRIVNDGVMGGLSQSRIAMASAARAIFQGELSLENNGGFASVRRLPHDYGLTGYQGVLLRVKADGRKYQFRVRTNDRYDGVSYRAEFKTKPGEWMTVKIPFQSLKPTFRGRRVPGAPELRPENIRQIGFLIADKREGEFRIEIDWLQAYALRGAKSPAGG